MPITIRANQLNYKNGNSYTGMDVIADSTTEEKVAAIEAAAEEQIDAIEAKGEETLENIPDDYTELAEDVDDLKNAVDAIGILVMPIFQKTYTNFYRQNEAVYDVLPNHTYIAIRENNGGNAMYLNVRYTGSSSWDIQNNFVGRLYVLFTTPQSGKAYFGSGSASTVAYNGNFALFDVTDYSASEIAGIEEDIFDAIGKVYDGKLGEIEGRVEYIEDLDSVLGKPIIPVFQKTYTNFYRQNEAVYNVITNHTYIGIRERSGGNSMYLNAMYTGSSSWSLQSDFGAKLFAIITPLQDGQVYFGSGSASTVAYNGKFALFDVTNYPSDVIDAIEIKTFDTIGTFYDGTLGDMESRISNIESEGYYYVGVGDSITAWIGASSYDNCFFQKLSDYIIAHSSIKSSLNMGLAGASTYNIGANCGAIGLHITSDIVIPASTTGVNISLNINIRNSANNLVNANPCYIGNIKGQLTYSSGNYVFTRSEVGVQTTMAAGTSVLFYGAKICQNAGITTIFVGTNDNLDTNQSETKNQNVCDIIKRISGVSSSNKYIVVSPYARSVNSDFRTLLSNTFGQRYFDLYAYFSGQGVLDAIAEGLITSGSQSDWESLLLADGLHPNDIGHTLIFERLRDRMVSLDWIN